MAGMGIEADAIYFVGANDCVREGMWVFEDGIVLKTSDIMTWAATEPDKPAKHCMVWRQGEGLAAVSCTARLNALCERKVP